MAHLPRSLPPLLLLLLLLLFPCGVVCYLPTLPPSGDAIRAAEEILRPMAVADFYASHYREGVLHYSTTAAAAPSAAPRPHPFAYSSTEAMMRDIAASYATFLAVPKGVRLHVDEERRDVSALEGLSFQQLEQQLHSERVSLVLQAEHLGSGTPDPLGMTQRALGPLVEVLGANGRAATAHYYLSGKNARALQAHDDRYDVVVLHMAGEKNWTTCVPKPTPDLPASLNEADRALLRVARVSNGEGGRERRCRRGYAEAKSRPTVVAYYPILTPTPCPPPPDGCVTYSQDVLAQHFDCTERLLRPGDVLYLPRGVPHFAHTDNSSLSLHATLALAHQDVTFPELVEAACAASQGDAAAQLASLCGAWLPAWHQNASRGIFSPDAVPLMTLAADARKHFPNGILATDDDIWAWFSALVRGAVGSGASPGDVLDDLKNADAQKGAHADVKQLRGLFGEADWRENMTDVVRRQSATKMHL